MVRLVTIPVDLPKGAIDAELRGDKLIALLGTDEGKHWYVVSDGVANPARDPDLMPRAMATSIVTLLRSRPKLMELYAAASESLRPRGARAQSVPHRLTQAVSALADVCEPTFRMVTTNEGDGDGT